MGIFGLVIIVFLLGSGIGFLIYSLRMLRRGSEVTAEEAIKWRRKVRKQGFDASPDMNPDITDILVRAWRTANGWINLGFGIGALLAGIGCSIFFAITGGALGGDDLVLYLAFAASILMALCPCVVICLKRLAETRDRHRHELCSDLGYACLFNRPERTLGASGGCGSAHARSRSPL